MGKQGAGWLPGSAVMAKCQSAVCQHFPQPQNPPWRRVVGLPAVLVTDRARLLWGRQGFFLPPAPLSGFTTCFHLEIAPFPTHLGPWGK